MKDQHFSRRERQIMDVIYARGEATVSEVRSALPEAPGYSAVRALLRILEEKGALRHREDGPRYVYLATHSVTKAKRSALRQVVDKFFEGSLANAVAALVDASDGKLPDEELERIGTIIKKARKK
jgi:predicted transcriptional regulator